MLGGRTFCFRTIQQVARTNSFLSRLLLGSSSVLLLSRPVQCDTVDNSHNHQYRPSSSSGEFIFWRQSAANSSDNRRNCPFCAKYGAGPCGNLFRTWLDCTDTHEGDHVAQCSAQFQRLHECLTKNSDYYDDDNNKTNSLGEADDVSSIDDDHPLGGGSPIEDWEQVITNEIKSLPTAPFPRTGMEPVVQRISNIILNISLIQKELVCAFCRSVDTGLLLAASSKADLSHGGHAPAEDRVILTVHLPKETTTITVAAVYEHITGDDPDGEQYALLCYTENVSLPGI